jgi:hypothetical protein
MMSALRLSFWLAIAAAAAAPVLAQPKKPAPAAPPQAQQQSQPPTAASAAMPDEFRLNLLIRSSIIALNQANRTGNYTVLQDLAAPAFRASNDSARLAQIFAELRRRNLDLTPILFFTPKLVAPPMINARGILRVAGFFPTAPERVNFELYFQMSGGEWRLFGIGVTTSPAEVTAAIQPQQRQQPQAPARMEMAGEGVVASVPPAGDASADKAAAAHPKPAPKAEAMQPPSRKSAPASHSEDEPAGGIKSAVRNGTTTNATRIDLAAPSAATANGDAPPAASGAPDKSDSKSGSWDGWSIFSRN